MDTPVTTRSIDVLLYKDMNLLDVAGSVQTFKTARVNSRRKYKMRYVTLDGRPVRSCCGLRLEPEAKLGCTSASNDLLIPGGIGVNAMIEDPQLRRIIQERAALEGDGRLISICSGALVLAAAGVLDGKAATTHWSRAADVRSYAKVNWDLDRICTTQGRVFTSAGIVTGIDLALAIVRADCGPAVALEVARELVVQLRRTGGQSQYALHLAGQFSQDETLARLIEQVISQPQAHWSLERLAETAGMNPRTLSRHFKRDLQDTPAQFVERVRVDHARGLLSENLPLKQVARDSGFGDLQRMRRAFQRRFGVRVSEYLNTFGDA